jgi:hypothetical protein
MYADKRVAPPLDGNAGWDVSFHPDQAKGSIVRYFGIVLSKSL